MKKPIGLLIMAYGTPASMDDVEPYYTHIRHGHKPTPELLENLIRRYEAIGGVSPLTEITRAQAQGIADKVNESQGVPMRLYLGMKHTTPFIDDAVRQMVDDGIEEAVTLVLAPHYSVMSVGEYQKAADESAARYGSLRLEHVRDWHLNASYLNALTRRVKAALSEFDDPADVMVTFTAHSLPTRILELNDPYPTQLRETGDAIAATINLPHHEFAWQSAGRTRDPWLGPDILDYMRELKNRGQRNLIVCPCGFVSDHLEVLYDLDIEAMELAKSLEMKLVRTSSLNTDDEFLRGLRDVVHAAQNRLTQN